MKPILSVFILLLVGQLVTSFETCAQARDSAAYLPVLQFGEALLENGDYDLAARVFYDVWHSDAPDSLRGLAAYRIKTSADSLAAHLNRRMDAYRNIRHNSPAAEEWFWDWGGTFFRTLSGWVNQPRLDSLGISMWFDNYIDHAHVNAYHLSQSVWTALPHTYWGQRLRVESSLDVDTKCFGDRDIQNMRDFITSLPNSVFKWDAHYVLGLAVASRWYLAYFHAGYYDVEQYPEVEVLREEAVELLEIAQKHTDEMIIYGEESFPVSLDEVLFGVRNREDFDAYICE